MSVFEAKERLLSEFHRTGSFPGNPCKTRPRELAADLSSPLVYSAFALATFLAMFLILTRLLVTPNGARVLGA